MLETEASPASAAPVLPLPEAVAEPAPAPAESPAGEDRAGPARYPVRMGSPEPAARSPHKVTKVTFASVRGGFQDDLKARAAAYFAERGLSEGATWGMVAKTTFWFAAAAAVYLTVILGDLGRWPSLAIWCVGGFVLACIGFNIGHDAIHGSYSDKKWVNQTLKWCFDVMGASNYNWGRAHVFRHHTYTNVAGADSDIEPGPLLRFYPDPGQTLWFHRFQHLYGWFLYSMAGWNWVFVADWLQAFGRDPITRKRLPLKALLGYFAGKAAHVGLLVVLPILVTPFAWWEVMAAYLISGLVAGFTLAIVFQMAHVMPGPEFPLPNDDDKVEMSWAEHQLRTTANFGGGNPLITFCVGGLDYQVEHHLFPKICHAHYPALSAIVKECAKDHGLPYYEHPQLLGALAAHYRFLKDCGNKESAQRLVDEQRAKQAARKMAA